MLPVINQASVETKKICINCDTTHQTEFCPNCGQPAEVRRITPSNLINDLQERIIGLDGRFPRTFTEAWKNPGDMSRSFIAGNRRRYIGPAGFFFIMLTVYLLSFQIFDMDISDLVSRSANVNLSNNASEKQVEFTEQILEMFAHSFKALSFFSVFITGFLLWLFNRRMKLNVVEHLVFAFYTDGIIYLVSIVEVVLMAIEDNMSMSIVSFILSFIYFAYVYTTYDLKGSRFRRILKAFAIRILSSVITGILVVVGVLIYAFLHPELFEKAG